MKSWKSLLLELITTMMTERAGLVELVVICAAQLHKTSVTYVLMASRAACMRIDDLDLAGQDDHARMRHYKYLPILLMLLLHATRTAQAENGSG